MEKETKSKSFMLRLSPTEFEEIKEISTKKRRTTSDMIRIIIQDYIEKVNL